MAYQALYRKYRPRIFGDVVGQAHITTILKNQIQSGRASHAYLFCGSRGTGKTSTAKIFSRAVNCLAPEEGEACGKCENCLAMEREMVDIIEIDAASNNGVDDVRALIEQARFTPLHLKYKVYIIDEVHMLSSSASNALLKTLEEPPEHVLFLLATTEPQKLLATVISRCQRFDFKRLGVKDIMATLQSVLSQAGASIDEEGLLTIARAADGGMRDALSLADQCLAFCGGAVTARDVYDVLGSMDSEFLFRVADALLASDAAGALRLLDEIVMSGRDLLVFTQDVMQHLRAVLLAKECGDCRELLDCTAETMQRYQAQAEHASQERLLRALELLTKAQNEMKWLGRPRVLLETVLVRICRPEDEKDLTALMDRIARLEEALRSGAGLPVQPLAAVKPAKQPQAQSAPPQTEADLPPWEEEAPPLVEPPPAMQDLPPETILPATPEPEKAASAAPADEAGAVWEKLRKALQKLNPSLYVVSSGVQAVDIEGNSFVLYFPPSKQSAYTMFSLPRNSAQIQDALKAIRADLQFSVRKTSPEPMDEQTKELKAVFGDKLRILE